MFFSIPYDAGWIVKVDGKKVPTFAIKDAVLGINLTAGQHTIEMVYHPVNMISGIMITIACILILAAITAFNRLVKSNRIDLSNAPAFIRNYFRDDDSIDNCVDAGDEADSDIN